MRCKVNKERQSAAIAKPNPKPPAMSEALHDSRSEMGMDQKTDWVLAASSLY